MAGERRSAARRAAPSGAEQPSRLRWQPCSRALLSDAATLLRADGEPSSRPGRRHFAFDHSDEPQPAADEPAALL